MNKTTTNKRRTS